MVRAKKETLPAELISGIVLPDDLAAKWRQVRSMQIAVQSAMDALLARSAANADFHASLWDETIQRLGLPDGEQHQINFNTMRVIRSGEPYPR